MASENVNLSYTTGGLANSIRDYLAKETLAVAEKHLRFYQLGDKLELGAGNGKVWTATRYKRLTLPSVALTEGTTPDGSAITTEQVTGTAEQWGQYVTLTDVGLLTLYHPALQKANEALGRAAAELIDREIQNVLETTTSINYTATGRDTIASTGILETSDILKAVAQLRNKGAIEYDGQNFVGVIDPSVEADIILDSAFLACGEYSNKVALFNGEIGTWMGVRFLRSNHVRTYYGAGLQVATGYDTGGSITTGTYTVKCVGYEPYSRLAVAITNACTGQAITVTTGSIVVTIPSSPTGYIWDVYAGATGGTPTLQTTGKTGGTTVTLTSITTSGASAPVTPATGLYIHNVYIFGKGAFGVIDLTNIEHYVTPPGPSDSDPLAQRRKVGWKAFFKAVILNDDFMKKIECTSNY